MEQNRLLITAALAVLLCSCLSFFSGLGLGLGLSQIGASPELAFSGGEPSVSGPVAGQLIIEDDFSRETLESYEDEQHQKGYRNGQYFILTKEAGYDYWSTLGHNLTDFRLQIETHQLAGPDNNNYGVIFRHQDDRNFYRFEISGDGYYTFGRLVDGEFSDIIGWKESPLINQGSRPNTLLIQAEGANFTFFINDTFVAEASDATFSQGDIGLLVGTFEEGGAEVAFDNLEISPIESQ